ncbi:MAG TPA: hypothetical protein DIT01_05670 [Lentisphaeria bacterium]|nr:hypothetical protein [Lentisphaeria bacterium]
MRQAFVGDLEAAVGVGVVRVMENRQGSEVTASAAEIDDVVVLAAVVLDQTEIGFLPVDTVGAGCVAGPQPLGAGDPANLRVPAQGVGGEDFVVLVAPCEIPHAQLAVDRDHCPVEADRLFVRRPLRSSGDDRGIDLVG